jgi:hypothetical protein
MWCGVVLLIDEVLSLNNWNNVRQQNFIAILLPRHRTVDNTQRTSSTMPDCSPDQNAASSVAVMFLQAAGCKPFSAQSMNVDSTIVEIERKPRFVAPHYLAPFLQCPPRLIPAPSLSQILVPWSQWDPYCWAVGSYSRLS